MASAKRLLRITGRINFRRLGRTEAHRAGAGARRTPIPRTCIVASSNILIDLWEGNESLFLTKRGAAADGFLVTLDHARAADFLDVIEEHRGEFDGMAVGFDDRMIQLGANFWRLGVVV